MAYKKYREMKVYEASGYQYKRTPSIVLKGKWLSELGFDIGEQIEVKCEDGRLIITKANEIWDINQLTSGQDGFWVELRSVDVEKADHKNGQPCIISFGRNLRQLYKLLLDVLRFRIQ